MTARHLPSKIADSKKLYQTGHVTSRCRLACADKRAASVPRFIAAHLVKSANSWLCASQLRHQIERPSVFGLRSKLGSPAGVARVIRHPALHS